MGDIKFVALPMDFTEHRLNKVLIKRFGFEIIGRMVALMENLSKSENEIDISDKNERDSLKILLNLNEDGYDLENFLDAIVISPYFKINGNILSSMLLAETQERLETKSNKARTNAQKRWKKCDGNATAMQPQCDGTNEKCDRIEAVCDGNADVCYNNTLQDITLQDKTIKNNTPHNSKTDDKTEVKHYTDKIIYNEDVRKFRNKRFVELADKLPPDEVSQLVNLESERLFVLREEAA
jgi:hypothetical protein